jgi:hypothetical protein
MELMVALAVTGLLLAAGYSIFLTQQKSWATQERVAEIQQEARAVMNLLMRDIRMAGHGVPTLWPVEIGGNLHSEAVSAAGSTLTLLGCFGAPRGYLSGSAHRGDMEIDLVDSDDFDTTDRRYILIGEYDKAIIVEKQGNTLRLNQPLKKRYPTARLTRQATPSDTQITVAKTNGILAGDILVLGEERLYVTGAGGKGITFRIPLQSDYPRGTRVNPVPVYFVQALRYELQRDGRITRQDLSGGGRQTLAEHIEALTFARTGPDIYRITLTATTDVPDDAGRFPSRTLDFTVRVRNPQSS